MAGKSVVGWVLCNKTEIPADGEKREHSKLKEIYTSMELSDRLPSSSLCS